MVASGSPGAQQAVWDTLNTEDAEDATSVALAAVRVVPGGAAAQQWRCSVAVADGRLLTVAEFDDGPGLPALEALLIQVGPKECLVAKQAPAKAGADGDAGADDGVEYDIKGDKTVEALLTGLGILRTEVARRSFNAKSVAQDVERLVPANDLQASRELLRQPGAMAALAAVLDFLQLTADAANFAQFALRAAALESSMRLDTAAVQALNVFPLPGEQRQQKSMSLFGLLDHCGTRAGSRLLETWLKAPLVVPVAINERLDLVESFVNDTTARMNLHGGLLKGMPDVSRVVHMLLRGKGRVESIVLVYQALMRVTRIVETLGAMGDASPLVGSLFAEPLARVSGQMSKFEAMVTKFVDLEAAVETHEFVIRADMHSELQELRDEKDRLVRSAQRAVPDVARDLRLDEKKVHLERGNKGVYTFRVTRKDDATLRKSKAYTQVQTRKDGILFQSPELRQISERLGELVDEYEAKQAAIVTKMLAITKTFIPVIQQMGEVLAHLDVIVAFAHVAASALVPYVRPTIHAKGSATGIQLKHARHPCVEVQPSVQYIPSECVMRPADSRVHIITGPNMGGKSTYIRSVGANVLLAQVGCFVPCQSADVTVVDAILARVGAGDSQLRGLSTFMAEMLEMASILRQATSSSLILADELGRGTSTAEGGGLAHAVAEYIAKTVGCFMLFATHFYELCSLADQEATVVNSHVEAVVNGDKVTLLYKVKPGPGSQSFGINVAELAGFPEEVMSEAKRKIDELASVEIDDGADGSAAKRRRIDDTASVENMRGFLDGFRETDMTKLAPGDALAALGKLRETYIGSASAE